jgi:dimethylhistidine N-methyltransferase
MITSNVLNFQTQEQQMPEERLRIHHIGGASDDLAGDVRRGLTAGRKVLQPKYFYDAIGSALFHVITLLPEYYATRAEAEILEKYSDEIALAAGGNIRLLELGSGSATKTRFVIEAILQKQELLEFIPVDISPTALESSSNELLGIYPALRIEAYAGDYFAVLSEISPDSSARNLVLFLGSNIGNFNYDDAVKLLRQVRKILRPEDCLLLGADLKKDVKILENAYDDPTGVTAAFNLNLLARINRELDADFDLRSFRHRAIYNRDEGGVEMHLESLAAQTVRIKNLDLQVDFAEGERIHTENSYKYDLNDLSALAAETGFERVQTWRDAREFFSSNLFRAV